ncbi:hypothetical protein [Piscinibacter defluvii]|uniref:hypothetical protein n=1 Tax=Piscinibacter defluvii TaxID=1796922 RepID=UPI000FDE82F8|nr:hypothetical protein [Piscinibacter defluvii]
MATFPARAASLRAVVASIAGQLDLLYLYLNEYQQVPAWLGEFGNVRPLLGQGAAGNLSATGKLAFLQHESAGTCFTLDDDILYPPDYVARMVALRERLRGGVALCVHGSVLPDIASWYYERSWLHDSETPLRHATPVNLAGSGTFCFALDEVPLRFEEFLGPVQVDLALSRRLLGAGQPLLAVPREAGWIRFVPHDGMTRAFKRRITQHTLSLRQCPELSSRHVRQVCAEFAAGRPRMPELAGVEQFLELFAPPTAEAGQPQTFPVTPYFMTKAVEFAALWSAR